MFTGALVTSVAFAVSIAVQYLVLSPFTVPSVSMENTLTPGDRILVNRLASGASSLERGDVVVFSDPGGWLTAKERQSGPYVVKRIIGLPGDRVSCCNLGMLTVNGMDLYEPYVTRPEGEPAATVPFDVTVPAGELWVMGDNRYHSGDSSRNQSLPGRGFVPIDNVIGHALLRVWPLSEWSVIGTARNTFASVPDREL